ncbi:hypothetical protein PIB30_088584 [Stylosanthes scabra]|uniref:Uncharacterized protein n=1 Tax=Stylosanthes scabra TaxID=79078 RepID=A0ABU6RU70_9FABA|nr:hypothetical protein [Stylosanthes scabra]
MALEFGTFAEIFELNGFFRVEAVSQPVQATLKPAPDFGTIHPRLSVAITSTPELRLIHRLRLPEALFILYISIPLLRFLSLQERSSSDKGHESPPIWLNEVTCNHNPQAMETGRKGDSKLEDVLGAMGMEVVLGCSIWSGGIAYVCVSLESRFEKNLENSAVAVHYRESNLYYTESTLWAFVWNKNEFLSVESRFVSIANGFTIGQRPNPTFLCLREPTLTLQSRLS